MTPAGTIMRPRASTKETKILEAKYKIFLETIDIQKRWQKRDGGCDGVALYSPALGKYLVYINAIL